MLLAASYIKQTHVAVAGFALNIAKQRLAVVDTRRHAHTMLENSGRTGGDESVVADGEHAKKLANFARTRSIELGDDGKSYFVAPKRLGGAAFEWHNKPVRKPVRKSRSMLCKSIDGVKLFKVARLHVESEQNEI